MDLGNIEFNDDILNINNNNKTEREELIEKDKNLIESDLKKEEEDKKEDRKEQIKEEEKEENEENKKEEKVKE